MCVLGHLQGSSSALTLPPANSWLDTEPGSAAEPMGPGKSGVLHWLWRGSFDLWFRVLHGRWEVLVISSPSAASAVFSPRRLLDVLPVRVCIARPCLPCSRVFRPFSSSCFRAVVFPSPVCLEPEGGLEGDRRLSGSGPLQRCCSRKQPSVAPPRLWWPGLRRGGRSEGLPRAPGRGEPDAREQEGGGRCVERACEIRSGNRREKTGSGVTSRVKGPLGTLVMLEGARLKDPYSQKNALR